ncbi:hypothetical protein ACKFKG_22890 [Phormidesmis sp. 146-35]
MKSYLRVALCFFLVSLLAMTQVASPAAAGHIQLIKPRSVVSTVLIQPPNLAFIRVSSVLRKLKELRLFTAGERAVIKGEKAIVKGERAVATERAIMKGEGTVAAEKGLEVEGKIIEKHVGGIAFGVGRVKVSSAALNDAMHHGKNLLAMGVSVDLARQLYESYNTYRETQAKAGNSVDPCKPVLIYPDGSDRAFSVYDSESCPSA